MKPTVGRIVWRPVVGWETFYEVSDKGDVRRIRKGQGARLGKNLKLRCRALYFTVNLCRGGVSSDHYVHHLVAAAFIGPRPVKHEVNHKNTDKKDNALVNLEYLTKGGNLKHSYENGRVRPWGNQNRRNAA